MRRRDGTVPRTAAALLLGLSAVTMPLATVPACGSDVETGNGGSGGQGTGGNGGHGGMATSSSFAAAYGVGGTWSSSSGAAAYGVPETDADGDGFFDKNFSGDDCNDMDKDIHPGAPETAGDGIDSNCDGEDDPTDAG